jgi:Brp/Blh family beta-carotene 15,15'-monooxygenase
MNKINYYHSLIFFNLCIFLSAFEFLRNNDPLIFCLFLILSLGISHGALDHLKGTKLLKIYKYRSMSLFYVSYIFVGLSVIIFWLIFPKLILMIFLIVASYHFGKEDSEFINSSSNFELIYFLKGCVIIVAPLIFHKSETLAIFEYLNFEIFDSFLVTDAFLWSILILSFMANILISLNKNFEIKSLLLMDYTSILILNYFLNPLLAFTIYFCFLHSARHSFKMSNELNKISLIEGLKKFALKAIPLTILTAFLFIISLIIIKNYYALDNAISKIIFIGLASLTFPHILLEYLLEKNEKK